jgi:hypothetical protein
MNEINNRTFFTQQEASRASELQTFEVGGES